MNKKQPSNRVFAYLLLVIAILTVICILASVALLIITAVKRDPANENQEQTPDSPTAAPQYEAPLPESADAGMEYINKMIFFGESTTTHLRARGVLSGGKETHQVWADSSGTKTLSSKMLSEKITYPPTDEDLTIAEAVSKEQPAYIVLSFGLNGIMNFVNNKDSYINNYNKLINLITEASPNTRIILQSVYPVSASCDDFSSDGKTVCSYTEILNGYLREIAAAHDNVRYADTASVLKNPDGTLNPAYDEGDGVHLNTSAYEQILRYLRTHAWQN
jgi:lysophospholipase L1-like esterase